MEKTAQYYFNNHVKVPGPAKAAVWPSKDRLKAGIRNVMAVIGEPIVTEEIKFHAWRDATEPGWREQEEADFHAWLDINEPGWREQEAENYAAWLENHPEWQDEQEEEYD